MSEGLHAATEQVSARLEADKHAFALEMGRRMVRFFDKQEDSGSFKMPDNSVVKYKEWTLADGSSHTRALIQIRDRFGNYIAQDAKEHESTATWFVLGEGSDVPQLYQDDLTEEHALEDAGNYSELAARRWGKETSVAAGLQLEDANNRSLELLGQILRRAESQAPKSA
jgi:hypothetical protein